MEVSMQLDPLGSWEWSFLTTATGCSPSASWDRVVNGFIPSFCPVSSAKAECDSERASVWMKFSTVDVTSLPWDLGTMEQWAAWPQLAPHNLNRTWALDFGTASRMRVMVLFHYIKVKYILSWVLLIQIPCCLKLQGGLFVCYCGCFWFWNTFIYKVW